MTNRQVWGFRSLLLFPLSLRTIPAVGFTDCQEANRPMTSEDRQQSLVAARRACEWLDKHVPVWVLDNGSSLRDEINCLIAEFTRLDGKEQAQAEAGRKHGHKGGRPKKAGKKRGKKPS